MVDQTSEKKGSDRNQKAIWGTEIKSWAERPQIIHSEKDEKEQKEAMRLGGGGWAQDGGLVWTAGLEGKADWARAHHSQGWQAAQVLWSSSVQ